FLLTNGLVFMPRNSFAGAWTQKKHGYFLKISTNYLYTTKEFNHEGDKLDIFQERVVYRNTSFQDFNVSLYAEYGLFNWLTLVGSVPFKALTSKRTELAGGGLIQNRVEITTAGIGDLFLAARVAVLRVPLAVSLQGGAKIPLGYDEKPSNDGPPLGTGEVDSEIQLLVGTSLYPVPVYLTGGIGFRYRSGPLHDEWFFSIEAGVTHGKWLFKANLDGLKNTIPPPDIVGQPVTTPLPGGGGALPNIIVGDQDIFKISPSVIYSLQKNLAVQAEALHIFAGKNTVSGTIFSLGFILTK
ncbi:MAG: hypothetical protein D6814_15540, partial [Calditrichaeota bacterium]